MRDRRSGGRALALACALAALAACRADGGSVQRAEASDAAATTAAPVPNPCTGFGVPAIQLKPVLTGNFSAVGDQIGADCMAWQSFIALNWQADPASPGQPDTTVAWSSFGDPASQAPTVWESYWEAADVFSRPLGTQVLWNTRRPAGKRLVRESKLDAANLTLIGFRQALDHKWLTAQNGELTYYEVRINQDEFEFITTNVFDGADLTTFAGQAACVRAGQGGRGGLNLPVGGGGSATAQNDVDCRGTPRIYGRNVGAIEIKAAWRILPSDGSLDGRYLTAQAQIVDPYGKQSSATVGLTGLHIIRRVPGAAQFVWATFEQIDNSPDQGNTPQGYTDPALPPNPNQKPRPGYTYFNPQCDSAADTVYHCGHNQLPDSACAPGQTSGCDPYSAPNQVTRITPVDSKANSVTGYVWSQMPATSVFNYYRLVNVQWPVNSTAIAPGATVPLTGGDITPSSFVANTTLETYLQNDASSNNCMACHQFASIAQPRLQTSALVAGLRRRRVQPVRANAQYASSYSFLFVTETRR
ncbi:MAG TPA: hypothetical protein VFY65_20830 [Longimicrobium sp.]|nr:hypothetical protein [Longimicrobium sp.]